MSYEINQQFVSDSFQALYLADGRSTLSREDLQARQELCEDLAQALSEVCVELRHRRDVSRREALAQCHQGLLQPPSSLPRAEAHWVACRIAELLDWNLPRSEERCARPDPAAGS